MESSEDLEKIEVSILGEVPPTVPRTDSIRMLEILSKN